MKTQTENIVLELAALFDGYEFFPSDGAYLEGETVAAELVPAPIGGSRVGHLEFALIPPGEYPAMALRLSQAGKPGREIVREAETTPAGRAALRFVLLDTPCALTVERARKSPVPEFELDPLIKKFIRMAVRRPSRGTEGSHEVEILLQPVAASGRIDTPWQVYLRAGADFWTPRVLPSGRGEARAAFNRLEPTRYTVMVWPAPGEDLSLPATGGARALPAREHAFAAQGGTPEPKPIEPRTIHLSEWPVDALLEGSSSGGSFLTFFTKDQAAAGKNLRYRLGSETGRIVWEETATAGLWRSDHSLGLPAQQAEDLAPSLVVTEIAPA